MEDFVGSLIVFVIWFLIILLLASPLLFAIFCIAALALGLLGRE